MYSTFTCTLDYWWLTVREMMYWWASISWWWKTTQTDRWQPLAGIYQGFIYKFNSFKNAPNNRGYAQYGACLGEQIKPTVYSGREVIQWFFKNIMGLVGITCKRPRKTVLLVNKPEPAVVSTELCQPICGHTRPSYVPYSKYQIVHFPVMSSTRLYEHYNTQQSQKSLYYTANLEPIAKHRQTPFWFSLEITVVPTFDAR